MRTTTTEGEGEGEGMRIDIGGGVRLYVDIDGLGLVPVD